MAPRSVHELLNHDHIIEHQRRRQRQQQQQQQQQRQQQLQLPPPPPPLPQLNTNQPDPNLPNSLTNDLFQHTTPPRTQMDVPPPTPPFPPNPPPHQSLLPVAKLPSTTNASFLLPTVQPPQLPPQTMHLTSYPVPPHFPPARLSSGPPRTSAPIPPPPLPPVISQARSPSASFDTSNSSSPCTTTHPEPPTAMRDKRNKQQRRRKNNKSKKSRSGEIVPANPNAASTAPPHRANAVASVATNAHEIAPNDSHLNTTPTGKSMRHISDPIYGRIRAIPTELAKPDGPARLSNIDRSPHIILNPPFEENGRQYQAFKGNKGYRSVRGTHPVCTESWYYEVNIVKLPGKSAVRLGWATRALDTETPVGYFNASYALRCQTGEFVSAARRRPYSEEKIEAGDTVGCLIVLPKSMTENQLSKLKTLDEKWLKYYHVSQKIGEKPAPVNIEWDRAYCEWFKNGKSLGIPEFFPCSGTRTNDSKPAGKFPGALYFPCVSLFNDAEIAVNMGPKFKFENPKNTKAYVDCAVLIEESGVQERPKKRVRKSGHGWSNTANGADGFKDILDESNACPGAKRSRLTGESKQGSSTDIDAIDSQGRKTSRNEARPAPRKPNSILSSGQRDEDEQTFADNEKIVDINDELLAMIGEDK